MDQAKDVLFRVQRSDCAYCLCNACHGTGYVTIITYPVSGYYDRPRQFKTKYKSLWLCDVCLEKLKAVLAQKPGEAILYGMDGARQ